MHAEKMRTKDITTVVLLSLINIVIFSFGSFLYMTPVTILLMPVFYSLLQGIVFFMLSIKVKKRGAVLLYCVIQGVIAFNIPYILMHLAAGILAELILAKTGYDNPKGLTLSYVLLQLLACFGSTIYPYVIIIDATLRGIQNSGDLSVNIQAASDMISSWGCFVLIGIVILSALLGALLGWKVAKKHLLKTEAVSEEEEA